MSCDLQTLLPRCGEMFEHGDDVEAVLRFLRQQGCSKLDSIKALVALKEMNLADAKRVAHLSKTWEDRRQSDEEFEKALWEQLIQPTESGDE